MEDPAAGGFLFEPELHRRRTTPSFPIVAGWRRERLPVFPDSRHIRLAPDWVCEVQSPSTARLDRVKKLPIYGEHRVQHVWLIDPLGQTLEVLRLENRRWIIAGNYGGDDVVRAEPFEAVS